MFSLRARITRLERQILPRYRACYARWQRLLAKKAKAEALQQRDPSTWDGNAQHFMTHWQFFLDRHPKLAQRLQNEPPAKAAGEKRSRGEGEPSEPSKIQNPKSKIDHEAGSPLPPGLGGRGGEEETGEGQNRSHSVNSAHLPAKVPPLPPSAARECRERGTGGEGEKQSQIEPPYTYERDERGCWIKVPIASPPPQTLSSPACERPGVEPSQKQQGSPLPPNLGGRGGGAGTGEGSGSYLEYFVSRGAKRAPSVKLDVGNNQPIHSNVVLPNLDED